MRRIAFTLVELLVVMAIITMLMAILLPSLGQAREQTRRAVCLAHQEQIGIGIISYASGNEGYTPLFYGWTPYCVTTNQPSNVFDARPLLLELAGNPKNFYCPSHAKLSINDPIYGWNSTVSTAFRFSSYMMIGIWQMHPGGGASNQGTNRYMAMPSVAPTNRPKKISRAIKPGDMALTVDSQYTYTCDMGGHYYPFTYPGYANTPWVESTTYFASYAYPHRDANNAWVGSNSVMFDGSGHWGNFNQIFHADQPYPFGAKWKMHDGWTSGGSGINGLEGCVYW